MNDLWVLVDISYLAYRAMHALGGLEFDGSPTGVIFGLFNQLRSICLDPKVNSTRVCLFFDSRTSRRERAFPDYKKKRRAERTDEQRAAISALWKQVWAMKRTVFPAMGISCYVQAGLESDDLLAQAARQIKQEGGRGVVVTADGDLYQAISRNVSWFDPQRNRLHDPESFEEEYGVPPKLWGEVKAIAGCKTDNVPGVGGVGEATAVKYVLGTLPHTYAAFKQIISHKGQKVLKRNRKLVVLPHAKTASVVLKAPTYNPGAFFAYCRKHGLASFEKQRADWIKFFKHGAVLPMLRKRGESRGARKA